MPPSHDGKVLEVATAASSAPCPSVEVVAACSGGSSATTQEAPPGGGGGAAAAATASSRACSCCTTRSMSGRAEGSPSQHAAMRVA